MKRPKPDLDAWPEFTPGLIVACGARDALVGVFDRARPGTALADRARSAGDAATSCRLRWPRSGHPRCGDRNPRNVARHQPARTRTDDFRGRRSHRPGAVTRCCSRRAGRRRARPHRRATSRGNAMGARLAAVAPHRPKSSPAKVCRSRTPLETTRVCVVGFKSKVAPMTIVNFLMPESAARSLVPRKSNALAIAERRLTQAREARVPAQANVDAARARAGAAPTRLRRSRRRRRLSFDAIDATILTRRLKLDEERARFAASLAQTSKDDVARQIEMITEALAALDDALAPIGDLAKFGADNKLQDSVVASW